MNIIYEFWKHILKISEKDARHIQHPLSIVSTSMTQNLASIVSTPYSPYGIVFFQFLKELAQDCFPLLCVPFSRLIPFEQLVCSWGCLLLAGLLL